LYVNFLAKNGKDININEIAKLLSLSYDTVNESIKFWEEQELLIKKPNGYLIANLHEIQLNKLYSPKVTSSPEDIEKSLKNKARASVIESINNKFFSGVMSPNWSTDIDLWFNKYGFDDKYGFHAITNAGYEHRERFNHYPPMSSHCSYCLFLRNNRFILPRNHIIPASVQNDCCQ